MEPEAKEEVSVQPELPIRTLAKGDTSGISTREQLVLRDAASWSRTWSEHVANQIPPPPAPDVNWDKEQVVAVFDGEKPSSGFAVDIASATLVPASEDRPAEIVVAVKRSEPEPGAMVLDVITTPHHIAAIPRVEGADVRFVMEPR